MPLDLIARVSDMELRLDRIELKLGLATGPIQRMMPPVAKAVDAARAPLPPPARPSPVFAPPVSAPPVSAPPSPASAPASVPAAQLPARPIPRLQPSAA